MSGFASWHSTMPIAILPAMMKLRRGRNLCALCVLCAKTVSRCTRLFMVYYQQTSTRHMTMASRSRIKTFFRAVAITIGGLLALPVLAFVLVWTLYFTVRWATTSYSIDWVDSGKEIADSADVLGVEDCCWRDCSRPVSLKDGRQFWIEFDRCGYKPERDRYELEILGADGISLKEAFVTVSVSGGEADVHDMRVELHRDSRWPSDKGQFRYYAVFPAELSPRKEGESLEIRFTIRGADSSPQDAEEIKLKFRARSVRHYLNIITDIT